MKSVDRFLEAAKTLGLEVKLERFPQGTKTADDAASAAGCDIGQIVKSLVFIAGESALVVLTSGANRVDLRKVSKAFDGTEVHRATADEAREATGFAVGGTPPFGYSQQLPILFDADLLRYESVWAAAGSPDTIFKTSPDRLLGAAGATVLDVKDGPGRQP